MKNGKHLQDKKTLKNQINTWIKKADRDDQSLDPEIRKRK